MGDVEQASTSNSNVKWEEDEQIIKELEEYIQPNKTQNK